jgi:hypothetical protein
MKARQRIEGIEQFFGEGKIRVRAGWHGDYLQEMGTTDLMIAHSRKHTSGTMKAGRAAGVAEVVAVAVLPNVSPRYQDELRRLFRRYGLEFDERYVWD